MKITQSDSPTRLMFAVLLAFVALNLFMPGESSNLSLILSQAVIYGFAGLHLAFIRTTVRSSPWMLPAVFWGLALVVSQAASLHTYDSLRAAVQFTSYLLLAWLVTETAPGKRELVMAIAVLVGVGAVLSIVGLLQVVTFFSHPPAFDVVSQVLPVSQHYLQQVYTQKRIFSTFILPTSFSAYLAIILPLAGGLLWHLRGKWLSFSLTAAATLVMLLAMLQAQSHGGPVALAIGAGLAMLLYLRGKGFPILRGLFALIAGVALIVVAIGFIRGHFLWDLQAVNSPIRLRWQLWQAGAAEVGEHWMTGIGAGNFPLVLYPHLSAEVRPTKYLHNTWLQLPLELGFLGALALMLGLVLLIRAVLRPPDRENGDSPGLRNALLAAVFVYLAANAIEIVFYFHSLGLLGAFLFGLWLRREPDETATSAAWPPQLSAFLRIGCAVFCAVALILLGRWFLADHFYNRAADMLTRDVVNRVEHAEAGAPAAIEPAVGGDGVWKEVQKLLQIATIVDAGNYRYHLLFARAAEHFVPSEPQLPLAAVTRALACNPALPSLYYSRALLALRSGRMLDAAVDLAQADRLHPSNREYQRLRREVEIRLNRMLTRKGVQP